MTATFAPAVKVTSTFTGFCQEKDGLLRWRAPGPSRKSVWKFAFDAIFTIRTGIAHASP